MELELQLFKLYHNEREIDELAAEMARKNQILEKETRKQQKIEDEVREKKKEHGKLIRDITKMEQQIKESVRLSLVYLFLAVWLVSFIIICEASGLSETLLILVENIFGSAC